MEWKFLATTSIRRDWSSGFTPQRVLTHVKEEREVWTMRILTLKTGRTGEWTTLNTTTATMRTCRPDRDTPRWETLLPRQADQSYTPFATGAKKTHGYGDRRLETAGGLLAISLLVGSDFNTSTERIISIMQLRDLERGTTLTCLRSGMAN